MKTKFLSIVLCCISFVSCRNNFDAVFHVEGEKLSEVYHEKEKVQEYEYDTQNRLIVEKSRFSYYSYTYKAGKRRITQKVYLDEGIFSSSSNVATRALNRKEWVNPQNTSLYSETDYDFDAGNRLIRSEGGTGYSEYEYDINGRIAVRKLFHEGELSGTHEYTYDGSGNLMRKNHYTISGSSGKVLSNTTKYQYDEMKNPYYRLIPEGIPGRGTNPNNVIRELYTVYNHPTAGVDSVIDDKTYSYQYNSLGYPTERNDGVRFVYAK
ncbi:MAG: hypothetical protein ABS46_14455 [Cytophagaceae bacterium SCN 52-12]|nr:MAG: hypothetical protein ABS46_14455 [Cytophagaceae bacterium SCN 52-12]